MPPTTGCEFGDVARVRFPFTDQTTTKKRPAVVVSSPAYHRDRPDVILMAITSRKRSRGQIGEIAFQRWEEAGLLMPSVLKPLLATVERGLLVRKLGRLAASDRAAVQEVLDAILGE